MNAKQQVFVSEYLKCWNASEAARRAGYNGDSNTIGPRLLANVGIKEAIQERLNEIKMSADEALIRLANMARSDIVDFADVRKITDLKKDEYKDKTGVIKKFKSKLTTDALGRQIEEVELELYPADVNLERIGKVHKLFDRETGTDDKPFIVKVVYGSRESGKDTPDDASDSQ